MGFYRVSDVKTGGNFLRPALEVKEDFPCGTLVCPPLPPRPFTPAGVKKSFYFSPRCLAPRFPPAPSPPRGVKGSLNTQFGFFGPDRGFDSGRCGAGLFARMGKRYGRSQWMGAWRGCESGAASAPKSVCEVIAANEHTRTPHAIGRAEQRSGGRIRAGACLSVASLRPTPGDASSARHPEGARPLARLFFAYFLLAKQKKVTRPARPKPVLKKHRENPRC